MVQATIDLGEHENRILNIVKGKFGLSNKSDAINMVINEYGDNLMEPELRPEYVEKAREIMKQKPVKVGGIGDFDKRYGLE
ncbi:MAG: DUF2683 family protein [Candidatus Altiarchaeales archaeon]|nr:DUF2683 family protein [Candidatus Altiarchaeota archaeon]MBU4266721.1 DUF2683 family protein [Candidatus Altiarchaeota archaeon]MBU4342039.1 DUF2683 family protein [Candidatus Altiarchaeota archaeon]MBU4437676.1 DUF2683 family protein [Candidatus Altiarchaeota archaeon]MCG2783128.1 DUF2683 family protein [Candidatus Altiarchaeales archaeon]